MGLLDGLAGQVMNSLAGNESAPQSGLLEAVGAMLGNAQSGGLAGLLAAFEQQGLGGIVASWVGTGANQAISAEQIRSVLGSGQIQALAGQLGISSEEVSGQLAQFLPQIVDRLTPNGTLPADGAIGGLLNLLKGS